MQRSTEVEIIVSDNVAVTHQKWPGFRPAVGIGGLLAIIFCALLCLGGLQLASTYQAQSVSADALKQAKTHTVERSAVATTPGAPEQSQTTSGGVTGGAVQTCVPYTASLDPSQIDLNTAPDGLTKIVDTPNFYQIYGNDAATLRAEVRKCAPKSGGTTAQYTAQTIYHVSWQYSYAHDSAGMCRIEHAKVGVHIGQVLPLWQPTAAANTGLPASWQTFMTALATHENGHTSLDVQYAQTLLNDINSFPQTACNQLPGAIQHLADSDIATLDQANDNYDSSTDHGATQGAILP